VAVQEVADSAHTVETQTLLAAWLQAKAEAPVETGLQRIAEELLAAQGTLASKEAFAALLQEAAEAAITGQHSLAVRVLDEASAVFLQETTMIVSVQDTLEAEAGDSTEVLGHYLQNVNELAGAWVTFKVSGEIVQGWVLNVEGQRPVSEYRGYEFNSFANIGGRYFAATDAGLYVLGESGQDEGAPIDAHVRTMMLDFGSAAQKRVVAAYLGYTSSGTVVLKVRSVDDGQLVEHWYEAQTLTADAPRAGYKPLGRGLKSRYWQFELANVDGADFELDKLELYPLQLSRRV